MNHIYDIFLNFNASIYDMFEWNNSDDLIHIRKIPLFRLNNLTELVNYKIKFSKDFLKQIYKKTEIFLRNRIESIDYVFLATDRKEVIAFKLDSNGYIKEYSKLLIDEEIEVLDYSSNLKISTIDYEKLDYINRDYFKTRNEKNIKSYISKQIKQMKKDNNIDKLKYLYLDCFNKNINSDNIINNIEKEIELNWEDVYLKVYSFLKLTTSKR